MDMNKRKIKNSPKVILNELKWGQDSDLEKAAIWYVHRGARNEFI
jgi:uncharacterized protein (UPF0248 family)